MNLVLDWDGTCTVRDSLVAAIHELGDPDVYEEDFDSYHDALIAEVKTITATAEEAAEWAVENVELRAGFRELVERFSPVIVSSGLPQLILPVLERERIDVEVRANFAEPSPRGWILTFRNDGPCPVCGDSCKRRALPEGHPLVYVGDGYSDRCASQAADRIFAIDGLARYLGEQGIAYEPFETLADVGAALA